MMAHARGTRNGAYRGRQYATQREKGTGMASKRKVQWTLIMRNTLGREVRRGYAHHPAVRDIRDLAEEYAIFWKGKNSQLAELRLVKGDETGGADAYA